MSIQKNPVPRAVRFLPWLFSVCLLAGCARHYDMTLTNGNRITNVTDPHFDREAGAFYYRDVAGKVHHVSSARVLAINPHSRKNTTPGTIQPVQQ